MSNDLIQHEPEPVDDDGFSSSLNSGRVGRGSFLRWNDSQHWLDRDGLTPPSPLLVVAVNEILQRWRGNKSDNIVDKPLPDSEMLNSTIPVSEWEKSVDGKPRPPWAHTVVVYLVNLATGETYTYSSATAGAHIAWNLLREAVVTMRMLRGQKCMPLVNLTERPMKTSFGMRQRPHFEIIGWKTPGGDDKAIAAKPTPQVSGPEATAASSPTAPPAPATASTTPLRQAKPPVQLSGYTLAVMGDVKPVSLSEELNDEIGF
jgi:hypothetical protein